MNKGLLFTLIITASLGQKYTYAASQDECAIWICLPGGFPSGCGAAYSAMKKRIKKLKSPLPPFSSCSIDGLTGGMASRDGEAARIGNGERWVKNTRCYRSTHLVDTVVYYPSGCTGSGKYVEVFENGKLLGKPYYFML